MLALFGYGDLGSGVGLFVGLVDKASAKIERIENSRDSSTRTRSSPAHSLHRPPTCVTRHLGRAVFGHGPRSVHLAPLQMVEVSGLEPPTSTLRKRVVATLSTGLTRIHRVSLPAARGSTRHDAAAQTRPFAPGAGAIAARVVDCYSVKPIDTATLLACCRATGGRTVVTEDPYPAGASAKRSWRLSPQWGSRRTSCTSRCGRSRSRVRRPSCARRPASRARSVADATRSLVTT